MAVDFNLKSPELLQNCLILARLSVMNKLIPARAATATSAFSLLSKSRYAKPLLRPVFLSLAMRNFVILQKGMFRFGKGKVHCKY